MKWWILLCLPLYCFSQDFKIHPEAQRYFDKKFKKAEKASWDISHDDLLIVGFEMKEEHYEAAFEKTTGAYLELRSPFKYKKLPIKVTSYIEDHEYKYDIYSVQQVIDAYGKRFYRVKVDTADIFAALIFKQDGRFVKEVILINYNSDL